MKIKLDLQRFAEGGAGSGGGDGGGAPMATGQSGQGSSYGMQPGQQMQQSQGMQPGFRDMLKDPRYKDEADAWIKETMDKRFKNQDQMKQQMQQMQERSQKMDPILSLIGQKYGKGADDLEGIRQALEDDDSLYEERAAKEGLPVKAVKKMDQLEKANQQYKTQIQQAQQDEAMRKHYQSLRQQEQELQKKYPGFNLQAEMQNREFLKMIAPGGVSLEKAYFAMHADEIQQQGMQYAGQQAAQAVAATVRSGALRPQENAAGMNAMRGMRVDVSQMTEEQLDEIDRQSRMKRTTLW